MRVVSDMESDYSNNLQNPPFNSLNYPYGIQKSYKKFTIFNGESLLVGRKYGNYVFSRDDFSVLSDFYGTRGVPYFTLIRDGVLFNGWVGLLQMETFSVEILPSFHADYNSSRLLLWEILCNYSGVTVHPNLSVRSSSYHYFPAILFHQFLDEVLAILRKGLIKKYRKIEGNSSSFRGRIGFSKNIQKNSIHQERIYTTAIIYDINNIFNNILYSTIIYIYNIINDREIKSKIDTILSSFPSMKIMKIEKSIFDDIHFDRKTEDYKNSILLAREILFQSKISLYSNAKSSFIFMYSLEFLWNNYIINQIKRNTVETQYYKIIVENRILNNHKKKVYLKVTYLYSFRNKKKYLLISVPQINEEVFKPEKIYQYCLELLLFDIDTALFITYSLQESFEEGFFEISGEKREKKNYRIYGLPFHSSKEFYTKLSGILLKLT